MIYILGQCAIDENYLETGRFLYNLSKEKGFDFYYKGSFDKANRSSLLGERGVGLEEGIKYFRQIKEELPDVKLTTDVHETYQIPLLKGLIDMVQIPAMLCRQTDLIVESAKNFPIVNIKKSQALSPENMIQGVDKIKNVNPDCGAYITERGSMFGYSKLIVDFGIVEQLKEHFDKVLLDCTHSTQHTKPTGRNGGDSKLAEKYFQVARVFGYDGIFAETHPKPETSISDSECLIPLNNIPKLIDKSSRHV